MRRRSPATGTASPPPRILIVSACLGYESLLSIDSKDETSHQRFRHVLISLHVHHIPILLPVTMAPSLEVSGSTESPKLFVTKTGSIVTDGTSSGRSLSLLSVSNKTSQAKLKQAPHMLHLRHAQPRHKGSVRSMRATNTLRPPQKLWTPSDITEFLLGGLPLMVNNFSDKSCSKIPDRFSLPYIARRVASCGSYLSTI